MEQLDALLVGIEPDRQNSIRRAFEDLTAAATSAPTPAPAPAAPTERELQAERRDVVRTLAQVLKPQRPPPYAGEIDADACNNFIDNQREYFTVVDLSLSEWVQYTALNLISDAKSWWRSSGLSINTPWPRFEEDFLAFHTPPNAVAAAREALESLKQGKRSVALYTHEFRRLLRRVPTLDKGTALHWFVKGLEPDTSKEVKLRQCATLEEAISVATLIHSILFPNGPTVAPKQNSSDMDIDTLHVAINNLTAQVNYLSQGSQRNNNTPRPSKLTPGEKAHLIANKGCFRCRKMGHMASNCRSFPNQPQHLHSRQFNNLETSAPQQPASHAQSGNANSN
ncbi:hypothetical protein KVV02_000570 [Mortierella alpina]|uniref:CCHC-type domain-containing protein n=1 Tax=Mortierella alpina TaxID=64518 RepID=A0A9P8A3E0_MORAP|nr:hypothetical protein BGZ67_009272 [Mortierella alpina]KAG9323627.1 hypothetical protein KVV02_000570 [Mortierella alpina]